MSNYNALIIRTDVGYDANNGHQWVVMAVQHKKVDDGKNALIEMFKFLEGYTNLHPLNCEFVNLCSDYKGQVGALICEDEFNPIYVGKIK